MQAVAGDHRWLRTIVLSAALLALAFAVVGEAAAAQGKIVFTRNDDAAEDAPENIWAINGDGTNETKLTSIERNSFDMDPQWSPDGRSILYSRLTLGPDWVWHENSGRAQIYVSDSNGAGDRLLSDGSADDESPVWSPLGDQIAFVRSTWYWDDTGDPAGIWVMNSDGTGAHPLVDGGAPDWSVRNEIAYSSDTGIYAIGPDGNGKRTIVSPQVGLWGPVRWSPDGTKLLVLGSLGTWTPGQPPDNIQPWGMYIIDAAGGELQPVITGGCFMTDAAWSPDSTKIVYFNEGIDWPQYRNIDCGTVGLHIVNADGTGDRFLTATQSVDSPDWATGSVPAEPRGLPPLIFVPGTEGSFLGVPGADKPLWVDPQELYNSGSDGQLDGLMLAANGVDPGPGAPSNVGIRRDLGIDGLIDALRACGGPLGIVCRTEHQYDDTLSILERMGWGDNSYQHDGPFEGRTLFFFAYDFRKSEQATASAFADEVDRILQQTDAGRSFGYVDVIAHSQGGLLVTRALARPDLRGKIHRVVTLGTPFAGAPKFLGVMAFRKPCLLYKLFKCRINPAEVEKLVNNFPGDIELLPSRHYYDLAPPPFAIKNTVKHTYAVQDWDGTLAELRRRDRNVSLVLAAQDQHASYFDRALADPGVEILRDVGLDTPTIQRFTETIYRDCTVVRGAVICRDRSRIDYDEPTNGDGTVPRWSAGLRNCDAGLPLPGDRDRDFISFEPGVKHVDLAQTEEPLAKAVYFLSAGWQPTPCPAALRTLKAADADFSAVQIATSGPLEGSVTDDLGRVIGTLDDEQTLKAEEIPGATFDGGEDAASYAFTLDGNYHGSWTATNADEVELKVRVVSGDRLTGVVDSFPISVPQGAKVTLDLSQPAALGTLELKIDDDANGVVDRRLPFGQIVAGAAVDDLTEPTSTVQVETTGVAGSATGIAHVTINAADTGGAGVCRVTYFVTASGRTGVYAGTFDLAAKGEIWVRAYDCAGNFQGTYTVGLLDDHPSTRDLVTSFTSPHLSATGYLGYAGDVDWWGFDVTQAARIQFQLTGLPADYDLALLDGAGNPVAASANRGIKAEKVVASLTPGHYFVQVTGYQDAWNDSAPYGLNVTPLG